MNKFELSTRRSLAIVSYIAASMGYSKEEIKFITAGMLKKMVKLMNSTKS